MAWKFHGNLEDLKYLLQSLNIKGKWYELLNTPLTQVQFKCENGKILNFYYSTPTILIQGRRRDEISPELLSLIQPYLS